EQARRRAQVRLALRGRLTLPVHRQKYLARIAFHRQRLSRRTEGGLAAGPAAELQRRQRRVLAEVARGDLVRRDADARALAAHARAHAVQPGLLDDAVRVRALAALVAQTADDRDVVTQRLEGFQNERKLEVASRLLRL